jgi:CheY-like chemotaxis protein
MDNTQGAAAIPPALTWSEKCPDTCMDTRSDGLILLAEHEVMLRNLVRKTLEAEGHKVLVAADGVEALQLARAHQRALDLLLADVEMPRLDGISAYRSISAVQPAIKVLFMTERVSIVPPSLPAVVKPFKLDILRATVNQVLAVNR